jgi:hypothetical protein
MLCWGDSGLAVVDDTLKQFWVPALATDGRQGAIVCWDYAYSSGLNAQRIGDATPITGGRDVRVSKASVVIRPSPARERVYIQVNAASAGAGIEIVAASGVVVRKLNAKGGTRGVYLWDRRDNKGRPVPAGVYFCRQPVSSQVVGKVILVPE